MEVYEQVIAFLDRNLAPEETLFLLVVILYATDCVAWLKDGSVLLCHWFGNRPRPVRAGFFSESSQGGLVALSPWPWSRSVLVRPWPISASPEGLLNYVAHGLSPHGRPNEPYAVKWFAWSDIKSIASYDSLILINDKAFATAASPKEALVLVDQLTHVHKMESDKRADAIENWLKDSTRLETARERWDRLKEQTGWLRIACASLFFWLFIGAIVYYVWFWSTENRDSYLLILIVGIVSSWVWCVIETALAHRRLFPENRKERRKLVWLKGISPLSAIRANDALAKHCLVGFHPLVATAVVGSAKDVEELASLTLRDLLYPIHPPCPSDDPRIIATESWFRSRCLSVLDDLVKKLGLDPAKLVSPPHPPDPDAKTYCPRCLEQYIFEEGGCDRCGGLKLSIIPVLST